MAPLPRRDSFKSKNRLRIISALSRSIPAGTSRSCGVFLLALTPQAKIAGTGSQVDLEGPCFVTISAKNLDNYDRDGQAFEGVGFARSVDPAAIRRRQEVRRCR